MINHGDRRITVIQYIQRHIMINHGDRCITVIQYSQRHMINHSDRRITVIQYSQRHIMINHGDISFVLLNIFSTFALLMLTRPGYILEMNMIVGWK